MFVEEKDSFSEDEKLRVVGHVRILRDNSKDGKLDREVKMTKYGFTKSLCAM